MPARYLPFHLLKDGRPIRFANWGGSLPPLLFILISARTPQIFFKKKRKRGGWSLPLSPFPPPHSFTGVGGGRAGVKTVLRSTAG